MRTSLAKYLIAQTEKEIEAPAEYLSTLHKLWRGAFWRLVVALLALRTPAPDPTARGVAAVSSMLIQDCGPCLEISVRLALREGADRGIIAALLARESLPEPYHTVYELAQGVYSHAPEVVELSALVEEQLGSKVRADIALTLAFSPIYPYLKRALGIATGHCLNPKTLLT